MDLVGGNRGPPKEFSAQASGATRRRCWQWRPRHRDFFSSLLNPRLCQPRMNPNEYEAMFRAEEKHWWYRALHRLIFDWLGHELPDWRNKPFSTLVAAPARFFSGSDNRSKMSASIWPRRHSPSAGNADWRMFARRISSDCLFPTILSTPSFARVCSTTNGSSMCRPRLARAPSRPSAGWPFDSQPARLLVSAQRAR